MYYVELKKVRFLGLIVILFFAFSFLILNVRGEDELVLLPDDEQSVNSDFSEDDDVFNYKASKRNTIVKRKATSKRESFLHDSVFIPHNEGLTFNALVMRVSFIIFTLFVFLVLIKMFLSRDQFSKPGSLLDNLAQKFTGSFANTQGLKLKQTLILTPGQNLYLIEIDGKRLLVGGTQQGGVQFLCDLTQGTLKNEKLDFKQIEEPVALTNGMNKQAKYDLQPNETPFMIQDIISNKDLPDEIKQKIVVNGSQNRQTFKRRTNFRKSLFNENMNQAEELLRKA